MYSFEDKIEEINREIAKRRGKWQLSSISYMDFEDVAQMIRLHIYEKWYQWDTSRPLVNWLNKAITNKMINIVRDNYGRFAPPCNGCAYEAGDNACSFTKSGEKCAECPLFKAWQKKKQVGYNLKLASSMDTEFFCEGSIEQNGEHTDIDYAVSSARLHEEMQRVLPAAQWKIYEMLFIQGMSEKEVAKELKLKTTEKGRSPGYKHLFNMRSRFAEMARLIIQTKDIL